MPFTSHDDYFAQATPEAKQRLVAIQSKVVSLVPTATPCISYQMPAFKDPRVFFYFAAFKKHVGVYPPVTQDAGLIRELAPYRNEKGNLAFPLDEPLPLELIGRVAVALHRQYEKRTEKKKEPT